METKDREVITVGFSKEELQRIKEAQCKLLETNRNKFIRVAVAEKCEKVLKTNN